MRKLIGLAALLVVAGGAHGGPIIYSNGAGPDYANGNEMAQWAQAEDFTGVAGTVAGVNYSVLDGIGGLASWDGTIQWQIFLGDPNAGNIVGAGNAVNIVTSFDQNAGGFDFWNISFDLDVPAGGLVGANTYWLSLHMGGDFLSDSLFWSTQAANGTATGLESNGGNAGPWNTNGTEHWYQLTPAPGGLALLAIGILGARRRRRE